MCSLRGAKRAGIIAAVVFTMLFATAGPAIAQVLEGVGRYGGADRYHTALLGSQSQWPDNSTNSVVLANAYEFADSLSASAICGELRAPLLLTSWGEVRADVMAEIERVTPFDAETGTVWLVGGTDVIGSPVAEQLTDAGFNVFRIGGDDRYETSLLVAQQLRAAQDERWAGEVWLVRGDLFPDGLAVSPYAYQIARPVLLTRPASLPDGIAEFMEENVNWAGIIGGPEAVSSDVVAERDALGIGGPRIGGGNRYETSAELARYALTAGAFPAEVNYLGIASGQNFPDALTGGIVAGQANGFMVLTRQASAPQSVLDFAADHPEPEEGAWVFGGFRAVSEDARAQFEEVLYP